MMIHSKKIKLLIIPYIALGIVLSLTIGIEYSCKGQETFPIYYGSPFAFKQKSLASSMEYFYSISGILLNVLIWSCVVYFLDKGIRRIIKKKTFKMEYKVIISIMFGLTTLYVAMDLVFVGSGFNHNSNYWYWELDKEAKILRMNCEGKLILF